MDCVEMRCVAEETWKNCIVWERENCYVCAGKERKKSLQAKE